MVVGSKIYLLQKTATKACVRMAKGETWSENGFKLFVSMAEIHVPRLWVEEHPDNSEQRVSISFGNRMCIL